MVVVLSAQLRDRGAAEECVQEAFLEAVRRWSKLARYEDPRAWLWLVALRRATRVRMRRARGEPAFPPAGAAPEWDVLIDLYDALQRLPQRQREVVTLHYLADLSVRAVALELGISEGTVKIHLHNIYEKLGVDGRLELVLFAQERGLV